LLAGKNVGHQEQVGFAVLIQGVGQFSYLAYMGLLAFPGELSAATSRCVTFCCLIQAWLSG
jgi:hypothetical protein